VTATKLINPVRAVIALGVITVWIAPMPGESPLLVPVITPGPNGRATLTIQNRAATTLVALLYTVDFSTVSSDGRTHQIREWGYRDAATERGTEPTPPNQSFVRPTANDGQLTLLAAIWADGSTFGDSSWVNRLLQRRLLLQTHLDNAISILQRALSVNTDTKSLIAELQTSLDNLNKLNLQHSEDLALARSCYSGSIQRFAKPPRHFDGTPATDREVLQIDTSELEKRRERLRQYR
jgi:hypothetical protein